MPVIAKLETRPKLSKATKAERRAAAIERIRKYDESDAGRAEISRIMQEMDAGKKTPLRELLVRKRRGKRQ